jgi:glycosyltransferase involved in cell wall biosynthesis
MIDIIIKTFNRYDSLARLLRSIEKYYPESNIIISDDSQAFDEEFYTKFNLNLKVLNLGVDVGLSYGRNKAMMNTKTPYVLLLDDDFVFDERTDIGKLLLVAEHTKADVVGGRLDTNGTIDGYNQTISVRDGVLKYKAMPEEFEEVDGVRFHKCDIVYNFGLFTKKFKWDNKIKIKGEHVDYFLQLKRRRAKVFHCPDVVITHKPERPPEYKKYRDRNDGFHYLFKKHKLKQIITASGQSATIKSGAITFKRV